MSTIYNEAEYKDGTYNIGIILSGDDGFADIQSPTTFEIEGGEMTATVILKDSDVDLMVVDGVEYTPIKDNGNPTFKIVIPELGEDMDVHTETVTGTQTVTEDYTMHFKVDTMTKMQGSLFSSEIILCFAVLALVGIGERLVSGFFGKKKRGADNGVIESEGYIAEEEDTDN